MTAVALRTALAIATTLRITITAGEVRIELAIPRKDHS